MLKERRRKIEEGMEARDESFRKLAETTESEKQILLKAEQEALALISTAEQNAGVQASQIIEGAHTKGEQVIAAGQKKLQEERLKIASEIKTQTSDLVEKSLVKVLSKMNPEERDRELIREALQELSVVSQ